MSLEGAGLSPAGQRRALVLVCLFAIASSSNYTNHAPLLSVISAEFGLSSGEGGLIATALFAGALLAMLLGGVAADRVGARWVVTAGFALVVASNLATGLLTPSYPALLAWRFLGGLGAGPAFIAGARYAGAIYGGRGAHLAQGLYGAAFLLGSGITLVYMPLLAGDPPDWRQAFVWSGAGVALTWVLWAALAPREPGAGVGRGALVGVASRARNTWILAVCHAAGWGMAMVVGTWATVFLVHRFGLPVSQAGALASLLLITGIGSRLGGGALLERGYTATRVLRLALVLTILGLTIMAVPVAWLPLAVLGLLVTGVGVGLPHAAIFNGVAASVPRSPASAQALVGMVALFGTVVAPPLVGLLLDLTGEFTAGFGALALYALVALISSAWLRPFAFE